MLTPEIPNLSRSTELAPGAGEFSPSAASGGPAPTSQP